MNHNPIIDVEVYGFFNMKGASFMVDSFENVDMVVHCSYSIQPFFCGRGRELVVVIKVYGAWVKAIETSVWGQFVGRGGCSIVGTFGER